MTLESKPLKCLCGRALREHDPRKIDCAYFDAEGSVSQCNLTDRRCEHQMVIKDGLFYPLQEFCLWCHGTMGSQRDQEGRVTGRFCMSDGCHFVEGDA